MDYPNFIISDQKQKSIGIQMVKWDKMYCQK